jgi:hypothetical protein
MVFTTAIARQTFISLMVNGTWMSDCRRQRISVAVISATIHTPSGPRWSWDAAHARSHRPCVRRVNARHVDLQPGYSVKGGRADGHRVMRSVLPIALADDELRRILWDQRRLEALCHFAGLNVLRRRDR